MSSDEHFRATVEARCYFCIFEPSSKNMFERQLERYYCLAEGKTARVLSRAPIDETVGRRMVRMSKTYRAISTRHYEAEKHVYVWRAGKTKVYIACYARII